MKPINDEEREIFEYIRHAGIGGIDRSGLALVSTELDGIETSVIAFIERTPDGGADIEPLAVIVNDEIMEHLKDPSRD